MGNGFFKKTDSAYNKQNHLDGQGVGETVFLRIVTGRTGGNPESGLQPTLTYTTKAVRGIVVRLTPEEVSTSAGIYQFGDLKVDLFQELAFASDLSKDTGDRLVYQKTTYRVVGRPQNQNIEKKDLFFSYIFRKVGNS